MSKFNFVEDARALMFVRQFHRKRIVRFLKNQQFREVENNTDLQRSKDMIIQLNGMDKDV
jgi:hypothetical protein